MNKVPEIRFRTYGEFFCFLPTALMGLAFAVCQKWFGMTDEMATFWWMPVLFLSILAASVDMNWTVTAAVSALLVLVVPASQFVGIDWVKTIFSWIATSHGVVTIDAMVTLSKWILMAFFAIWVVQLFSFYEISPNRVETIVSGRRDWSENLNNMTVSPMYDNFFKQLCFGMGDLVFLRSGVEVRRIHDVPFLFWGRWKSIENMIKQVAVTVVEAPAQ